VKEARTRRTGQRKLEQVLFCSEAHVALEANKVKSKHQSEIRTLSRCADPTHADNRTCTHTHIHTDTHIHIYIYTHAHIDLDNHAPTFRCSPSCPAPHYQPLCMAAAAYNPRCSVQGVGADIDSLV